MFFKKKSISEKIDETKKTLHDIVNLLEIYSNKTDSKEFTKYLLEVKEKIQFMVKGKSLISSKFTKSFKSELDQIMDLLKKYTFEHAKIDKKRKNIDQLVLSIELL